MTNLEYSNWRDGLRARSDHIRNIVRFKEGDFVYLQVTFKDLRPALIIPSGTLFSGGQALYDQPITDKLARSKVELLA